MPRHGEQEPYSELGRRMRQVKKVFNPPKDVNLPLEGPAAKKKQAADTARLAAERNAVQQLRNLATGKGISAGGKKYGVK